MVAGTGRRLGWIASGAAAVWRVAVGCESEERLSAGLGWSLIAAPGPKVRRATIILPSVFGAPTDSSRNALAGSRLRHRPGSFSDPGPHIGFVALEADQLLDRLGPGAGELAEQLPPAPEQRAQQAWDREYHVAVRNRQEHIVAQPLRPQELLLLLARGAEAAAPAGEGASTLLRHSPHHSRAKPCSTRPQVRNARSTPSTTDRKGPWALANRAG